MREASGSAFEGIFRLITALSGWWLALASRRQACGRRGRAWAEISLPNLRHNTEALRRALPGGCRLMAVVKANAYGHGDVAICRCLSRVGVDAFAVATVDEGVRLRKSGVRGEILVLGYTPVSRAGELSWYRLTQAVVDAEHARELDGSGKRLRVHIKVNTGMNRLGEDWGHVAEIASVFSLRRLRVTGIFTHLCVSDRLGGVETALTERQIGAFRSLLDGLRKEGIPIPLTHLQSSYGVLNYPGLPCDLARVGIALYGVLSTSEGAVRQSVALRPVLELKSRVVLVRSVRPGEGVGYGREFTVREDMRVAVVSIGYGDGLPRSLSLGKGRMLIRGRFAPVVGRICMDQLAVDVTGISDVRRGDMVTLIGTDGGERISAEEVAAASGTITNELLSRLGGRLERVFLDSSLTTRL